MESKTLLMLGFSKVEAKVIEFLWNNNEFHTSREIEVSTGLRQPEVSVAVCLLRDRNWIEQKVKKKEGKGRPYYLIKLDRQKVKKDIIESISKKINRLREIKKEIQNK